MFLTITSTSRPATDLGYLLHKHPDRLHSFDLSFGAAHVFYPEATEERCTAALLLDVDTVALVRAGSRGPAGDAGMLQQYVNDRPYVASSFMSVAISRIFGTALGGRSKDRPELAATPLPLEVQIAAIPCRGGAPVLRSLFEPLGYELDVQQQPLDLQFPEWGDSRIYSVRLRSSAVLLRDLLAHLYVLIPVLDDEKHYWVGDEEVQKLLRHGGDWLAVHPAKEMIVNRYLRYQRHLTRDALQHLLEEDQVDEDEREEEVAREEEQIEEKLSLNEQRLNSVLAVLKASNARRVIDLGCGEGRLLHRLLHDRQFEKITGMDVSHRALSIAQDRLKLERMPELQRERIQLFQGSLMYRDERLAGYDAAVVVEVIEHLDKPRLAAFERVLFEFARPSCVIVTTPNREYNVLFETLPAGEFRHRDHRFEWSREQFGAWATQVSTRFGYAHRLLPIGEVNEQHGSPTQMAVFTR